MKWITSTTVGTMVQRAKDDRALVLQLNEAPDGRGWQILALETGADYFKTRSFPSPLEQVLDDHAHKLLALEPTLPKAIAAAEKYARAWQRSGASLAEACACKEIPS